MKLFLILFFVVNLFSFELQKQLSPKEFSKMGLDKLNYRELDLLNNWLSKNVKIQNLSTKNSQFEITYAKDEELFKIEDKLFRAKIYCPNWSVNDVVVFIKGDIVNCENVKIKNLNQNNECELSCK